MDTKLLAIYLNDHLAMATGGVEFARRMARENRGTKMEADLQRLADQVAEDREALVTLMGRMSIAQSSVKVAAGWVGEKIGRLKPSGRLIAYSPLSRLLELEAMSAALEMKRLLWEELRTLDVRLEGVDLEALVRRAEDQRKMVDRHRPDAAKLAFA
jgi:hypothetical protein